MEAHIIYISELSESTLLSKYEETYKELGSFFSFHKCKQSVVLIFRNMIMKCALLELWRISSLGCFYSDSNSEVKLFGKEL